MCETQGTWLIRCMMEITYLSFWHTIDIFQKRGRQSVDPWVPCAKIGIGEIFYGLILQKFAQTLGEQNMFIIMPYGAAP